jgi:uncharacterized iron-regulated protein
MIQKLLLIASILPVLAFAQTTQVLEDNSEYVNTLERLEYKELDIENNDYFSSFKILDDAIEDKKVFFIGEDHRYRRSNSDFQLKLLRYLHDEVGLKNLIIEQGKSTSYIINKYVVEGDEKYKEIIQNYAYPYYYEFYVKLYEYNKTLPDSQKIVVHGIDMERSISNAYKALGMMTPKKKAPKEIMATIESIRGMAGYYDNYFSTIKEDSVTYNMWKFAGTMFFDGANTLNGILEDWHKHDSLLGSYIGEDYPLYTEILEGLEAAKQWYEYQEADAYQEWVLREEFMYQRFEEVLRSYPEEKFLGSFGRCHTSKTIQNGWCDLYGFESLANRINASEDSVITDKVLTIGSYYPLSPYFYKKNADVFVIEGLSRLVKVDQVMLFKVDQDTIYKNVQGNFDFVAINKRKPEEEKKAKEVMSDLFDNLSTSTDYMVHFDFALGRTEFNLGNFNTAMNDKGYSGLPSVTQYFQFAIQTNYRRGGFGFTIKGTENYELTNPGLNASIDMMNWDSHFEAFWDIIPSFKADLLFGGRLGYGSWIMTEKVTLNNNGQNALISESNLISRYNNWFGTIGVFTQARINFKYFSIGYTAGYNFDYSGDGITNSEGDNVFGGTGLSASGYYWGAHLSLPIRGSIDSYFSDFDIEYTED